MGEAVGGLETVCASATQGRRSTDADVSSRAFEEVNNKGFEEVNGKSFGRIDFTAVASSSWYLFPRGSGDPKAKQCHKEKQCAIFSRLILTL